MASDRFRLSGTHIAGLVGRLRPYLRLPQTPVHPRVAASVTLGGAILATLCLLAAPGPSGRVSSKPSAGRISSPAPMLTAVGSGPAFCKEQTWPNIDARCIKRAEPTQASEVSQKTTSVVPPETKTTAAAEVSQANQALLKNSSEPAPTVATMVTSGIGSATASSIISSDTAASQPTQAPATVLPVPPGSVRLSDVVVQQTANDKLSQVPQTPAFESGETPSPRSHRSRHGFGVRLFNRHTGPF